MTLKEHLLLKEQGNLNAFPMRNPDPSQNDEWGLTKREYFAAMILSGLAANHMRDDSIHTYAPKAVKAADALIEELMK
jgi:hypothetical protein